MRRIIVALLSIGFVFTGWHAANAAPRASLAAPIHLTSLHMIDVRVGWGQNGRQVFRTVNGGQTWTDVTPSGARQAGMGGAFFLSANRAWLTSTTGSDLYNGRITVYRTADAGLHWRAATAPATGIATPSFANGRDGWLFVSKGPGAGQNPYILLRTVDGGARWQVVAQSTPTRQSQGSFPGCDCTGAITFRNRFTGWSTGTQFALPTRDWFWLSTNGGHTWRQQSLAIPHGFTIINTEAPVFSGPQGGAFLAQLVHGSHTGIFILYTTYNGGVQWTPSQQVATRQGGTLSDSVVDPHHAWVSDGHSLYRTVDGTHWKAIYPQVPAFARGFWTKGRITASSPDTTIDFVSATTGFAYNPQQRGTRPFILKTVDGGITWQAIYPVSG